MNRGVTTALGIVLGIAALIAGSVARAQDLPGAVNPGQSVSDTLYSGETLEPVHWAFSSFFGTGWYQISNNRTVYVLRIPPRWTIRKSAYEEGQRQSGLEIHFPVTLGLHDIDDLPGIAEPDNFGTISFTPGIEFEIPVTENYALRPFVLGGYGYDFEGESGAWIYQAGIKSRYRISRKRATFDLLLNGYYGGYYEPDNTVGDQSDDIGGFLVGAETTHRLGPAEKGMERYRARWHLSYSRLTRKLEFLDPDEDGGVNSIDDYFTIGFALAPPSGAWSFWLYKPRQLGLALEFSPEGDYAAIKINTRDWFSR